MSEIPQSGPEWLFPWLQIPFYKEKCHIHMNKYNTIFCGVCMKKPTCEICWRNQSKDHADHMFLQVFAASRRAAIRIKDIKKLWDISYIQHYKVNSNNILYLHPNLGGVGEQNQDPKCQKCKRKLLQAEYKFCSIICKFMSMRSNTEERSIDNESMQSTATDEINMNIQYSSKRRKINHRKGIPQRAPIY